MFKRNDPRGPSDAPPTEPQQAPQLPPLRTYAVVRYNENTGETDTLEFRAHGTEIMGSGDILKLYELIFDPWAPNGVRDRIVRVMHGWEDYWEVPTAQSGPAPCILLPGNDTLN